METHDLANGGQVKKYHVALMINTGTSAAPVWTQIKKTTDNTITMNATTKDLDFIVDESPTTVLDQYKPSMNTPLTMFKGEEDYNYVFDKFYKQAVGNDAVTDILIVFLQEKDGTAYKAWKSKCVLVFDSMSPTEGTITPNINFNGTTDKGTVTITNGNPVFTSTAETEFTLTVNVKHSSAAVAGATVMVGGTTKTTDASGNADFVVKDGEMYTVGATDGTHEAADVFTAAKATTSIELTLV